MAEQVRLARFEVRLVHVAQHRHGEHQPPRRGDDERDADAVKLPDAEAAAEQHDDQAHDERDTRSDIAPRIALGRNLVVAILLGGVDQERIVEHQRRVEHDRREHVYSQEHHGVAGHAHDRERYRARADGSRKELLLVALQVGQAAQKRHEQGKRQRGYRGRIAPGHHGGRPRFGDGREIDGDERCRQHDVCGVSHIVQNPAALAFRQAAKAQSHGCSLLSAKPAPPAGTRRRAGPCGSEHRIVHVR